MGPDFSRISFDAAKHYAGILMQQGRVVTDADQVEDENIHAEEQRRTQEDIIGSYGSPDSGFSIANIREENGLVNFDIADGTIYLGGIRLEMEKAETFLAQSDWLHREGDPYKIPSLAPNKEQYDLVYLEAWQQPVCAVEDSSLFEPALGGPDTSTRLRNMRRVKIQPDNKYAECSLSWLHMKETWKKNQLGEITDRELISNLKLKVTFGMGDPEDLCSPTAAGGYLGAENQAIRVQLVKKGNKNYFTWGFDNSSPLYRVKIAPGTKTVKMETLPKDQFHWPVANQVVEILPWSATLPNNEKIAEEYGFMSRVETSYKPDEQAFDIEDNLTLPLQPDQEYFFMRVWNRGTDVNSDALIEFNTSDTYTLGNTGVQLHFSTQNNEPAEVLTGDFWVIAVRPETPEEVYPWELKAGMFPFGIRRFYGPLAVIRWQSDGSGKVSGKVIQDCRNPFHPLTHHDCCCTFSVGDGINSKGDFNSLQEAIDHMPEKGGKICLLPGIHTANAQIINRKFIHISGCGIHSIVKPDIKDDKKRYEPVFLVANSQWICLENMTIVAPEGIAINVEDGLVRRVDANKLSASREIVIRNNYILALINAVRVRLAIDISGGHHIHIVYNRIGMINAERNGLGNAPDVAIFSLADDVLIERNRITIVPFRDPGGGRDDDDDDGDDGDDDCDCDVILRYNKRRDVFRRVVVESLAGISLENFVIGKLPYKAKGGIQIGCGSEKVLILRNEIFGGAGYGILLGHIDVQPAGPVILRVANVSAREIPLPITQIEIEENTILGMYLSGIGSYETPPEATAGKYIVPVRDISIYRNKVMRCALQLPERDLANPYRLGQGGISLALCEDLMIRENRIENNGNKSYVIDPVCGIYILYAEKTEISSNRILHNGSSLVDVNQTVKPGYRAGIYIGIAARSFSEPVIYSNANLNAAITTHLPSPVYVGEHAAKIHDNIVVQPLGHALIMDAVGPVSAVSNQFTSMGVDRTSSASKLAGVVLIKNLGISSALDKFLETFLYRLSWVPYNGLNTAVPTNVAVASQALRTFGGKVMFTANQTTFDLRLKGQSGCWTALTILTRDDIAFNCNQTEALTTDMSDNADRVIINTFLASAATVRSSDNLFSDDVQFTYLSLFSLGLINTTADNQSTHCVLAIGAKKAVHDNLVISGQECSKLVKEVAGLFGRIAGFADN